MSCGMGERDLLVMESPHIRVQVRGRVFFFATVRAPAGQRVVREGLLEEVTSKLSFK